MPIRSPHGRAAAYRALWQWPLYSPARLAVTLVLLAAVIAGVTVAVSRLSDASRTGASTGEHSGPTPAGAASGGDAVGRRVPSTLPPVPELTPTTLPLSQAPAEALDVAARFARAWVNPGPGVLAEQWRAGLRGLTTPEYFAQLAAVDPQNVPATRVTGAPRAVQVAARSVRVEVPTDALTLLVLVVRSEEGWRVAGYDQA